MRSISQRIRIEGGQTCQPRKRAHHEVDAGPIHREAAMAAAARNAIRSSRNRGGRSSETGRRSHTRRSALVGDLELQTGMDHVGVVSDDVLVRGVELGPALFIAHFGQRDVRERVS